MTKDIRSLFSAGIHCQFPMTIDQFPLTIYCQDLVTSNFSLLQPNMAWFRKPEVLTSKFECSRLLTMFCRCAVQNVVPTHFDYGDVFNELEVADNEAKAEVRAILHNV